MRQNSSESRSHISVFENVMDFDFFVLYKGFFAYLVTNELNKSNKP